MGARPKAISCKGTGRRRCVSLRRLIFELERRRIRPCRRPPPGEVGLRAELFASVQEFLDSAHPDLPGCLVLDVRLPGRSGLDFQEELAKANIHLPATGAHPVSDNNVSDNKTKSTASRLDQHTSFVASSAG